MQLRLSDKYNIFYYISTKANTYTPAKTIYVCAPDSAISSYLTMEQFAKASGWIDLAEEDGAVLVMPIAKKGWEAEEPLLIAKIYAKTRQSFMSKNGDSIPGREGNIWCWETLIYLVGYDEGAKFAGDVAVAYPNRFAGVALVNGTPSDYTVKTSPSDHWLVKNVSSDYNLKIGEIPLSLWMFLKDEQEAGEAVAYFSKNNQINQVAEQVVYDGIKTKKYWNAAEEAHQIRVSVAMFNVKSNLERTIMKQFFNKVIRWKNSPDGTLKTYLSKSEFYQSSAFVQDFVTVNNYDYPFFTYLPKGMNPKSVAGLPVVFSAHGRGEPSWIFATKNGWDKLADETKAFILVLPDSLQNMWFIKRDSEVFGRIIDKLYEHYSIDKTRVYMTGFSNGGMITRQMGNAHPELFAAISPWSAPFVDNFDDLLSSGYELPCYIFTGDNDPKVPLWENLDSLLENMLIANDCNMKIDDQHNPMKYIPNQIYNDQNHYTKDNGYTDGTRFQTFVYNNKEGKPRVYFSLMKNMPHGAIYDQSRAAWEFLRRFKRLKGSKKVMELE